MNPTLTARNGFKRAEILRGELTRRARDLDAEVKAASGRMDLATFERLVRVEAKLDGLLDRQISDHTSTSDDMRDHESRLRNLEHVYWKAAGISAAVSMLVGGFVARVVTLTIGG